MRVDLEDFDGNILVENCWWKVLPTTNSEYFGGKWAHSCWSFFPAASDMSDEYSATYSLPKQTRKGISQWSWGAPRSKMFFYVFMASLVSGCDSKIFCWDRKEKKRDFMHFPKPGSTSGPGLEIVHFGLGTKDSQVFWLSKRVNRVISSIATKVHKLSIYLQNLSIAPLPANP